MVTLCKGPGRGPGSAVVPPGVGGGPRPGLLRNMVTWPPPMSGQPLVPLKPPSAEPREPRAGTLFPPPSEAAGPVPLVVLEHRPRPERRTAPPLSPPARHSSTNLEKVLFLKSRIACTALSSVYFSLIYPHPFGLPMTQAAHQSFGFPR